MSKFIEDIKKIYNKKKDLKNPPSYIKTIKELLELEEVGINEKSEMISLQKNSSGDHQQAPNKQQKEGRSLK